MWATGVKIPDLEESINSYLEEIITYLKDNSLLISAPKSTVTLFNPYPHHAKTHQRILIEDSQLPLVQCQKIVYLDTSLSFNKHSSYVAERVSSMNNILKALAGTSWGQQETLLMTYKAGLQTTHPTSGGAVTADSSCCAICVEPSRPQQWGPDLPFFGHAGHADSLDSWRCCSQRRVMSRPIQVRQL